MLCCCCVHIFPKAAPAKAKGSFTERDDDDVIIMNVSPGWLVVVVGKESMRGSLSPVCTKYYNVGLVEVLFYPTTSPATYFLGKRMGWWKI
jgi:hypothetical protein